MEEKKMMDNVKKIWNSKSTKTKKTVSISSAILVVLVMSLVYLYTKDSYEFLLSTDDKAESANVISLLKEQDIKYDIKGGGIYVAGVNPDALLLELAGNGYLDSTGSNMELFSKPLFISEKQEDKIIQKDLEDNISSTIKSYNEVADAKVLLTMGKESSFKNDVIPATAAIQVKLKSNLSSKQVKSIQEFVAAAVPNLSAADVVITDTNNNLLSSGSADGSIEDNTVYTKSVEDKISSQISELLSVAFPTTSFKVVSRVQVNFDATKIERETVSSGPDTVVSKETHSEITTSNNGNTTAGTETNVPGYETPNNKGQAITEIKDELVNYELNKTTEQITKQPEITNVNVTVVADKPLTAVETEKIRDLAETASGYNEKRGDKVAVHGFEAENIAEDKDGFFAFIGNNFESVSSKFILLAIIIAIVLIVYKIINSFGKTTIEEEVIVAVDEPKESRNIDDVLEITGLEKPPVSPELLKKREVLKKEIEENPEQVATVFKTWLDKEK